MWYGVVCNKAKQKNCSGKKDGVFGMRYVRVASAQSLFSIVFFLYACNQANKASKSSPGHSVLSVSFVSDSLLVLEGRGSIDMDGWIIIQ